MMGPLAPGSTAASQSAPSSTSARSIKPLVSLKGHKRLALAVMIAVAILGLPIAWVKGKPAYYSEAGINIAPRFAKNLTEDAEFQLQSNSQYREFVQQQVRTIVRYDIIDEALKRLGPRRFLWQREGESDRRATDRLMDALQGRPVPDSYLISVGLEGPKSEGLAEIVNTVVDAYMAKYKQQEFFGSDVRVENLMKRRVELLKDIQTRVGERTTLAQELGITTFEEKFINPYDKALIDGNETLAKARQRRIEADAKLEALIAMQRRLRDLEVDSEAWAILANDRSLGDFKTLLFQRRSALTAKISGLSGEHVGRQADERELRQIDAEMARATESALSQLRTMLTMRRTTAMTEERARAQAEVGQTRQAEEALAGEVERLRANVAKFAARYQEALYVRSEIDRSRKQLNDIDDRLDFIALESNAPGFVRIESRARAPEIPTKGGRTKLFALLLVAAVGVGLVVPTAIDCLDGRIKSPAEVEGLLGFPPLGWIVERNNPQTAAFAVDQLRRLALAIEREQIAHGTACIAVTAAKPGGGATTLVLDLARMLTDIGVRTIAVEANAFKSDGRFADGDRAVGFAAALAGTAKIETAIVPATDVLPDRLPIGETDGHPHLSIHGELRPALDNVFQELKGMYDLILLDVPPILLSADAELLIGVAGATLLVLGAEQVTKGEIQRAARSLERLSPPVVGVIVNRVHVYDGGGYFAELLREYETRERAPGAGFLGRLLRG